MSGLGGGIGTDGSARVYPKNRICVSFSSAGRPVRQALLPAGSATTASALLPVRRTRLAQIDTDRSNSRFWPVLTQIVIVNLAARFHEPVAVRTGSLAALCAVAAPAIAGGRGLLRMVSVRVVTLVGAALMAVLAVISLASAITG